MTCEHTFTLTCETNQIVFTCETNQIVFTSEENVINFGPICTTGTVVETGGSGSIAIEDIAVAGGSVSDKVYQDAPGNTVLQSATVSGTTVTITVRSTYPLVVVGGVAATLPPDGDVFRGTVDVTISASGNVIATLKDGDNENGAVDTIQLTLSTPPAIQTAVFTGGYPGSQTELKEGDTFQLQVTADKDFDQVVMADFGACKSASIGVVTGTSATVTVTIDDEGDVAQLLGARLQVRDAVTAALSASYDTDSAGSVDGVNVVNCNDLHPSVAISGIVYPGAQEALKASESATVNNTASDYDSIAYTDPTAAELTITNPAAFEAAKNVDRAGGTYNISTTNFRITANRAANDADTVVNDVVQIASVAAVVGVTEATARVRSGPAPGSDTTITITSDQQLLNAPSLDPAASAGTFQGSWSGGPSDWTRSLRVPDAENPADGSINSWQNLVATNLAGIVTNTITGNATYVIGGFTSRTINFAAFTANSTEDFPLTTEAKLTAGVFSNGNPAVVQPFGTADTTDVGKEGWCAPTAASGVAVNMRMLHSPTVSANSGGLTLTLVAETV